ncbi:hypothetical protein NKR23_g8273 [Pleurostoma richardsiae]|uniref:DUF202 domain-containing protein n=1 Tax=Pleurostoma richardsiae TaxID=41990 RepID=A0AA38R9R7_9PEZI|nr:hypothetical protein NKR23_g8273 [Pleurostoma richardsiae]
MDAREQPDVIHDEEDGTIACCAPLEALTRPVEVGSMDSIGETSFWAWPFFGPLLFANESSDCRDHCANERTFLSYLRLSVYMAIVAVAIVLSFHLKSEPSPLELRMAKPLGAIFWTLAVACLVLGLGNYIKTVNKYSRRAAIVQSGWRTQSILSMICLSIIGTCITLLVINRLGGIADEL